MKENETTLLATADRLVRAFSEGRVEDYFACFHPEATFVFYTSHRRLESRADWRKLWNELADEEGFQVLECNSTARRVQHFVETAVLTHDVETRVATNDVGEETLNERETIVFFREAGEWLVVHEHLSPVTKGERA